MSSPLFVILNSINLKTKPLDEEYIEKEYNSFMVNRFLSLNLDTCLIASQVDQMPELSKYDQYLFYYHSVERKKRYNKFLKNTISKNIKTIQEVYNYSVEKAINVEKLLSKSQFKELYKKIDQGGQK